MPLAEPPPSGPWSAGWYRRARALPSPNFGPRPAGTAIDLAIVHSISLPPGRYGGDEVQALFTNTLDWDAHPYFQQIRGIQVSAHFYLRRTGVLWQFVSVDDRAWHAGTSRFRGRDNCNDYAVGIELEGLEGERFTARQYTRLATLIRALAARYPITAITGHEQVAPGRKHDPGPGFDWHRLQQTLAWDPAQIGTA
jgi:AmpD protein